MAPRIPMVLGTAFLLAAGLALAAQDGHIQLKYKDYPVSEEFRSVLGGAAPAADPVLGTAGDYVVRQSDIDRLLAYYPAETRQRLEENPAEREPLVRRMLEVNILAGLARNEKFDRRPGIQRQLAYVADDFLSKEYLAKVVVPQTEVSEADIREYYDQNRNRMGVTEQVHARHILFKVDPAASPEEKENVRQRAEAILQQARAGEDFAALAAAHSDDPGSRAKGGDLGYFGPGQMVREFEEVAFFTEPGETSDIVETRYGYHIIKVEDHIEARERSFAEMKGFIREKLHREVVLLKVQNFIRQATEEAGMQVYAERISAR